MILFPTEHITQGEDVYALKKCLETISFYCEHNENLSDLFRLPASHLDSWSKVLVRVEFYQIVLDIAMPGTERLGELN